MRDSLRLLLAFLAVAVIPACGLDSGATTNPPQFNGLTNALPGTSAGEVILSWSPATDTTGDPISYNIYLSYGGPGTENLSTVYASTPSTTGITLTGLTSHNSASIIVQAQNSGGTDGNTIEFTVTVP